jgi:hypothetical protein
MTTSPYFPATPATPPPRPADFTIAPDAETAEKCSAQSSRPFGGVVPIRHQLGNKMDMFIILDDRHQAHVPVVSEELARSRGPLWPAFVIAFAICATLLWAGTLLWLLSRMLLFLLGD